VEVCVCGNVLDAKKTWKVCICICRCDKPASKRTIRNVRHPLSNVSERRYTQRKALGLPFKIELEKSKEIMGDLA